MNFLFCFLKREILVSSWPEWTGGEMLLIVEREGILGRCSEEAQGRVGQAWLQCLALDRSY